MASTRFGRRLVALVAAAACLAITAPQPAEAARPIEVDFLAMVNEVRAEAGKPPLALSERLSKAARRHSRRMAEEGTLFHSRFSRFLGPGGGSVAENVGWDTTLPELLEAFLASPHHAENLLDGWRQTGIGAIRAGGRLWVTQIFRS